MATKKQLQEELKIHRAFMAEIQKMLDLIDNDDPHAGDVGMFDVSMYFEQAKHQLQIVKKQD